MTSIHDLRSATSVISAHSTPAHSVVPRPLARWRTRVLVPLTVVFATIGVLGYAARDAFHPRIAVHVAAVIPATSSSFTDQVSSDTGGGTASVELGWSPATSLGRVLVQAPGWIEPAPYATTVPALAEGVVREVLVLEGDRVEAGQVVARLVDDDAKLRLRSAEAAVAEREADVERAKAAVERARAQIAVEQALADELADEVERKRGLVTAKAISEGEFRQLQIRLAGLTSRVAAAETVVSEARASLQQAHAMLATSLVAVDEAKLGLSRTVIIAPSSGVVLTRLIEPGSRISMSSNAGELSAMSGTVLRLYNPASLQVRVDVPLADAAKVSEGTLCTITSEALPDETFTGTVVRVVHEANIQRNTVQFKVSVNNPSSVLKPEMLTRVKLHSVAGAGDRNVETKNASEGDIALLVPSDALLDPSEGRASVWLVDMSSGTPVARKHALTISAANETTYARVHSGLRLTDRVILDPPSSLHEGSRLTVLGEHMAP